MNDETNMKSLVVNLRNVCFMRLLEFADLLNSICFQRCCDAFCLSIFVVDCTMYCTMVKFNVIFHKV
mgnify:CR=1 FL=1